jgi:DNA-binding transcriptional ArsR family regulator
LSSATDRQLAVSVSYGDVKVEFSGSPDVVFRSLHEFISKEIPNIDLAKSISVNYSLNDLIQMFRDYIRFTEEGPRVWSQDKKLSDKDVIALQLVAAKAAMLSGKARSDDMNVVELQAATSLLAKTIGSRLSELYKAGAVDRVEGEGTGRYRITTTGVHWLHAQLSKKFSKPSSQTAVS